MKVKYVDTLLEVHIRFKSLITALETTPESKYKEQSYYLETTLRKYGYKLYGYKLKVSDPEFAKVIKEVYLPRFKVQLEILETLMTFEEDEETKKLSIVDRALLEDLMEHHKFYLRTQKNAYGIKDIILRPKNFGKGKNITQLQLDLCNYYIKECRKERGKVGEGFNDAGKIH